MTSPPAKKAPNETFCVEDANSKARRTVPEPDDACSFQPGDSAISTIVKTPPTVSTVATPASPIWNAINVFAGAEVVLGAVDGVVLGAVDGVVLAPVDGRVESTETMPSATCGATEASEMSSAKAGCPTSTTSGTVYTWVDTGRVSCDGISSEPLLPLST